MKLWGSKKQQRTCEVMVDIRSASVAVSIVAYGAELPEVLYAARVPYQAPPQANVQTLRTNATSVLKQALERMVREGLPHMQQYGVTHVRRVLCTLGAPWYESFMEDVVVKQDKPFVMTEKKFTELLDQKVGTDAKRKAGNTLVEHDVTKVVINGYELRDPFNKKTNEMTISFYASFVAESTLSAFTDCITDVLPHSKVRYRTYPAVLFTACRDMFWNIDRFTFIDVSGLLTEIGIVDHGTITHMLSVPFGSQYVVSKVQEACGTDAQIATSAITMLARGETHEACTAQVETSIQQAQQQWVQQITAARDQINTQLPKRIFLVAEPNVLPLVKKFFLSPESRKNIFATDQEVQLVALSQEHLNQYVTLPQHVVFDPFTVLTALFLQATT